MLDIIASVRHIEYHKKKRFLEATTSSLGCQKRDANLLALFLDLDSKWGEFNSSTIIHSPFVNNNRNNQVLVNEKVE